MKQIHIFLTAISAVLLPLTVLQDISADIYKYTDKNGTVTYTDTPHSVPEKSNLEIVKEKNLPESKVQKLHEDIPLEKKAGDLIAGGIESLKDTRKIRVALLGLIENNTFRSASLMLIVLSLAAVLLMTGSFIWHRGKRKINLLIKRNNLIEGKRHSGQLCRGYDKCIYPGSIQKHTMHDHFLGESSSEYRFCHYQGKKKNLTAPANIPMGEYEKFLTDNSHCHHPSEFITSEQWMCYKCYAIVSSERERHC